ncbi:MAG: DUF6591 domain-containing protein [Bulleidia sp.]
MKLIKMDCPYCGAQLQVEEGKKITVCPYCGQSIAVDDEKKETIVTVKDQARMEEADLKKQQYQDSQKEKEKEVIRAFHHSRSYRWIVLLMILSILGMAIALFAKTDLACLIALGQIVLLVMGILSGTERSQFLAKVPVAIFITVSLVLSVPYFRMLTVKARDQLAWPATDLAARIPEADTKYGKVSYSTDDELSITAEDYDETKFQDYIRACKEKGFTVDAENGTSSYSAADSDGYVLELEYYSDEMHISLSAPADYSDFTWPISDLASLLPAPPVSRGSIERDTSDTLNILIPDMDREAFHSYAAEVKNAGFDQDYTSDEDYFSGTSLAGAEITLRRETGNVMDLYLKVTQTTPEPASETTSAASATPENTLTPSPTPAATAPSSPAAGIRPEFKEAMDSYAAFFDSYCDFMRSYDSSDLTMMTKYAEFMSQYADMMAKLDAVDESELSPEEEDYYIQTMTHINDELAKLATEMN